VFLFFIYESAAQELHPMTDIQLSQSFDFSDSRQLKQLIQEKHLVQFTHFSQALHATQ
jgi:hypothetical protein